MICDECKKFYRMQGGYHGVCTFDPDNFPVTKETECVYGARPLTCEECARYGEDFACRTARSIDLVNDCPGFIDKNEETIKDSLYKIAYRRGKTKEEVVEIAQKLIEEFERDFRSPFEEEGER